MVTQVRFERLEQVEVTYPLPANVSRSLPS